MGKKKDYTLFCISIGSFLLMSVSFLFMPIDFAARGMKIISLLIGVIFWVFLIPRPRA